MSQVNNTTRISGIYDNSKELKPITDRIKVALEKAFPKAVLSIRTYTSDSEFCIEDETGRVITEFFLDQNEHGTSFRIGYYIDTDREEVQTVQTFNNAKEFDTVGRVAVELVQRRLSRKIAELKKKLSSIERIL
jgi:hypothetical protein